jgi:hypothetical protein
MLGAYYLERKTDNINKAGDRVRRTKSMHSHANEDYLDSLEENHEVHHRIGTDSYRAHWEDIGQKGLF